MKKILVVDDETAVTRGLKRNLEATGRYLVHEVNIGSEAYTAAKAFTPDLIILDVMMPDVDGGTVAAQVQEDPQLSVTPIIFLTAIVREDEVGPSGTIIGGRPFLAKPVRFQELIACIESQISA